MPPTNGAAQPKKPPTPAIIPQASVETPLTVPAPQKLLELAIAHGADIEKLRTLLELQLTWERNEARKAFVESKNAFKSEAPAIFKNSKAIIEPRNGGGYEYNYAELDKICTAVIELLASHGLDYRWRFDQASRVGWVRVTCILTHRLGHEQEASLEAPEDHTGGKNPVQAISSTTTYLERITLLAVCGLAARGMDTDGNTDDAGTRLAVTVLEAKPDTSKSRDAAGGLARGRREQMVAKISCASSSSALWSVYKAAYKEAHAAGDKAALAAYIAAKDARLRGLNGRR